MELLHVSLGYLTNERESWAFQSERVIDQFFAKVGPTSCIFVVSLGQFKNER